MPLPLLELGALAVGMLSGKADLEESARAAAREDDKQRLINEGAVAKEQARGESEAKIAREKAIGVEIGKAKAVGIKAIDEQRLRKEAYGSFVEFTNQGMSLDTAANLAQYKEYKPDAFATFTVPEINPETSGYIINSKTNRPMLFPVQITGSTKSGASGGVENFEGLVSRFDNEKLQWWKQNDVAQYNRFTDILTKTVRMASGISETPSITGQTAALPVILPATLQRLSSRYGADYALNIAKNALAGMQLGEEAIREMYPNVFGLALASNAEIRTEPMQTPGGTAIVQSAPNGGGWIKDFDLIKNGVPVLNQWGRSFTKRAAEANNIGHGKFEARVVSFATTKAEKLGDLQITPGRLMYDIAQARSIFSGEAMGDERSENPAYNDPGSNLFFDVTQDGNDLKTTLDFIASYGLFSPGSDYNVDLGMLATLAPIGRPYQYPRLDGEDNRGLLEGGIYRTAQIKQKDFYVTRVKEYDDYFRTKYEKIIGGKLESFRDKGLAAGAGITVIDSLISLGEQTNIPIPVGFAASGIKTLNSWAAQIKSIVDVADVLELSPQNKSFLKEKLTKTQQGIEGMKSGGEMTLSDVATAIAARDYFEGVLVYSMAMALQGGNAAARTISDADITRIREILSLASGAGPEQRKAIYGLLKPMLARQKSITDAVVGGGEAGAWAGVTFMNVQSRTDMARQELDGIIVKAREIRGIITPANPESRPNRQAPTGFYYDDNGNLRPLPTQNS